MTAFISVFPPYRGGIARFSQFTAEYLKKYRSLELINFSTLYPPVGFPGTSEFASDADEFHSHRCIHSYNPLNWKKTVALLESKNVEHILFSNWHPYFALSIGSILSSYKKRHPEITIGVIPHNVIPHESFPFQNRLLKRLFSQVDVFFPLSHQTKSELETLEVDAPILKLFHPAYPNPISQEKIEAYRREWGVPNDVPVYLFFGLIRKYKGLDTFLKAASEVIKSKKIFCIVAGECYDNWADYEPHISNELRENLLHLDRFVTQKEAAALFHLSDALVLPYRSASQSGVVADALYAQLPVLASDLKGLREYVIDGETGFLFSPNLTGQLNELLSSHSKSSLVSMRPSIKQFSQQFSWDTFALQIHKHLT